MMGPSVRKKRALGFLSVGWVIRVNANTPRNGGETVVMCAICLYLAGCHNILKVASLS